ncbi:MAG: prepilin peptidase [Pseudomonadota bacterium]
MFADPALLTLLVAAPVALATVYFDLRYMEIPNWLTGGAAVIFTVLVFATLPQSDALWRVAGAAIVFVICVALFFLRQMGGGDAKSAPGFALLVAPPDVAVVLFLLSVIALMGLATITLLRRTRLAGGEWKMWQDKTKFPYGVALGLTALIYLSLVAFLVP